MTGNLIGEKFNQYVFEQINQRQILYGKGYQGGASKNLKPDDQILINNNNSFLKLASGINIFQPQPEVTKKELEGSGELEEEQKLIQGPVEQGFNINDPFLLNQNTTLGTVTDNDAVAANNAIVDNINEQIKENNKLQFEAEDSCTGPWISNSSVTNSPLPSNSFPLLYKFSFIPKR